MAKMNAAVVTSFSEPPHYQQFEVPQPRSDAETLVDVLAVGLHPRVRTGAAGAHYTSTGTLPMIPGIDGVGQRPDGKRIYFVADDDVSGTMAEKAVVDLRRAIELPDDVDVTKVAAAMNPAMSAWVALRRRVPIEPGELDSDRCGRRPDARVAVDRTSLSEPTHSGRRSGRCLAEGLPRRLPSLVDEINAGTIEVKPNTMPLSDVEAIWSRSDPPGERTVLVP
jgi:hypothetical protein